MKRINPILSCCNNLRNYIPAGIDSSIICIMLIIFSFFITSCSYNFIGKTIPVAVQGELDFSNWNFTQNGPVRLDGEWEFHWKKLLQPDDFEEIISEHYHKVPGTWSGKTDCCKLQGDGFATYRLLVNINNPDAKYGLKIKEMATAFNLYVDGELLCSNGIVAKTKNSMVPQFLPKSVFFTPKNKYISIILQVSNFYDKEGGAWHSIHFGLEHQIIQKKFWAMFYDIFLFGILLIIGFYHSGLFVLRRNKKEYLYFALICFFVAIRTIFMGERLVIYIFPDFNWEWALTIEHSTSYLGFTVLTMFIVSLFSEYISKILFRALQIIGVVFFITAVVTPARIHTELVSYFQVIIIVICFYLISIIIKSIYQKKSGSVIILIGLSCFFLFAINDILYDHQVINTTYLVSIGLIVFIFSQSFVLSIQFSNAFSNVSLLSDELKNERDNLEKKVDERTKDLIKLNRQLEKLSKNKSEFLTTVAHELCTPLTLIITPIILAMENEGKYDKSIFHNIYLNSQRLLDLLGGVLQFSRIEESIHKVEIQKINIVDIVKKNISIMESGITNKGIVLKYQSSSDEIIMNIDIEKIDIIITNLLSNAIKYTEITERISINIDEDPANCYIIVEDTGTGIRKDMVHKIFKKFEQIDSSSTQKYSGIGIGLYLVEKFVKLHGGTVTVESSHIEENKDTHGTKFIIALPKGKDHFKEMKNVEYNKSGDIKLAKYKNLKCLPEEFLKTGNSAEVISDYASGVETTFDENGKPADKSHPGRSDENESTILIVEDNRDMVLLLQDILGNGYHTITASNGKEALQKLESSEQVDLMLTDVMMPEMDGYELTEAVRKNEQFEGLPVILLTAKSDTAMKIEGLEKGATDYVTKPFNPRELTARIDCQLEMKLLRDRLKKANLKLYDRLRKMTNRMTDTVTDDSEKKIQKVREFIMENFDSDLSREGLAAAVDMSPDHLSRMFNRVEGKKIGDYINELRIEEAARLLRETEYHVITISHDMGFDNIRTFNRVFRSIEGMSPSEYRKSIVN